MRVPALFLYMALVSSAAMAQSGDAASAESIFINGDVYTGAANLHGSVRHKGQGVPPRAQAFAVRHGRIVAVGANAEIQKLKGKKTKVVDLGGRFTMPGFNDAHLHLASGGMEKLTVSLTGARSLEEMLERIAAKVKTAERGQWIVGRGWDHTLWPGQKLPTRYDLDKVTGDHPAVFTRVDGHISVANSKALQMSSITRETKDPPGGTIDRGEVDEPTGILRESARGLLAKIPDPTPSQRRQAVLLALTEAAQNGLTSAQDNSDWQDFLVYEDLQREDKLTLRITEWMPFRTPVAMLQQRRAHHDQSDPMLRTGLLKAFMDGTLGSRTAYMLAPYADDPKNTGLQQFDRQELMNMARERVLAGFQLGFHAIGDAGVDLALDAFEHAARSVAEQSARMPNPGARKQDFRFRIEHAQVMAPEQFARMKKLGVIGSMQPNHLLTDMNWAEQRIGKERARVSYPWREMLKHGIVLAFGTDYPVEPLTPFRGLYAAVSRKNLAGTAEYVPEQKITIDEAIAAYTTGAAFAEFAENDKGALLPGMFADFIVLDRDVTKVAPPELLKTRVLRTVVGGKTVYEAAASAK